MGEYTPGDSYRCRFGTIWTLVILEIVGTLATLVVCIWALSDENIRLPSATDNSTSVLPPEVAPLAITGIVLCVLSIAFLVSMFLPQSQMRFRAGSGIFGAVFGTCVERSSTAPSKLEDVLTTFQKQREKLQYDGDTAVITPVGGAWSGSLAQRFVLPFPRMYLHGLKGRVRKDDDRVWYAGTTLKTVQNMLADTGRQLIGVPSSSYVTLGAWIATLAHGNTGAAYTEPILRVSARVLDKKTGVISEDSPATLVGKFGGSEQRAQQFVVLTVTLPTQIPPNRSLRRSCRLVKTADDLAWFLRPDTLMRALFVGQSASLAMTWTPLREGDAKPPGSGVLDKLRILALAGLGWGQPDLAKKDAEEKVSDAVYFFPDTISNVQNLFQVYLQIVNAEFFTRDISEDALFELTQRLEYVHSKIGGRTELRIHNSVTYLDVAIKEAGSSFALYLRELREFGVTQLAQHRGKHQRIAEEFRPHGIELVNAEAVVES